MLIEKLKNVYNDFGELTNKINEVIDNGGGGGGGDAVWGDITGNIQAQNDLMQYFNTKADKTNTYNKTEVDDKLAEKQNVLTAGQGIVITNDTIRANIIDDTQTSATTTWSSDEVKRRFDAIAGSATIVVVATLPTSLTDNTLYYVGTASPYHIWLRSAGVTYDMGTTEIDLSGYQEKLISGTNIKTINNESILGSGNIEIDGGSMLIEDLTNLITVIDGTTYNLISGKSFSDYKIIRFILRLDSGKSTQTVDLTPAEFSTGNLSPAGNYNTTRIRLDYVSDTSFIANTAQTGVQIKIVGYKNLPNAIQLQSGMSSGTTNISSGTNSFQVTVNIPQDATPTGLFVSTEGNVGIIYASVLTKISNGVYRVSGWYNVGGGALAKATIMWIKI